MKISESKIIEWFLRIAVSAGFLSATADRLGLWPKEISAWGNWQSFVAYTKSLNPLAPDSLVPFLAYSATGLEILFGILLLTNFKTNLVAKASGVLLLIFALSMTFSKSIKTPLDYSVFCAAAAAFALSIIATPKQNNK
jgi:thiosulfate dehydrogenase (quinone) large subunit